MKINQNMAAVVANFRLLTTENRLAASMERLSSGYKINSAGDNPAGIAISNKMRAQIDALDQAEANAADGVSVLQIADGALNETTSMIQRMRELCVQAANGTNSLDDRKAIQKEIDELEKEVDRIASDTEYNTKTLLDGSSDVRSYSDHATRLYVSDTVTPGIYSMEIIQPSEPAIAILPDMTAATQIGAGGVLSVNDVTVDVSANMTYADLYASLRDAAELGGCYLQGNGTLSTIRTGSAAELKVAASNEALARIFSKGGPVVYDLEQKEFVVFSGAGKDAEVKLGDGYPSTATYSSKGDKIKVTDLNGFSIDFLAEAGYKGKLDIEVTDIGSMTIQIGANQYQTMDIRIPEISAESLYLDTIDVTVKNGSEEAMVVLDEALAKVSEVRSRIGAFQNRLEYATSSLAATHENMTAAYSQILDTDMAEEMTEYTQQNVLDQAAISVLSQANDIPQQVLSLLQR